ncbi:hypothetical protein AAC03nite_04930 [Alicyclobacillus acidoterrestris]|nr:hypothetical protein AAC03nite_04930 [Alicyclobacillus acidoterrestris]
MIHEFKIRKECTLFFAENPYTYETVEGVAHRIGRKMEHVQPALDELVQISILEQISAGAHTLYRYQKPDMTLIGEFDEGT